MNRVRRKANTSMVASTVSTDLISQYVYVLDTVEGDGDNSEGAQSPTSSPQFNIRTPICVSSNMFALILLIVTVSFAFFAIVILHVLLRNR